MNKKIDILKQILLISTGEYYEINLSQDLVPGIMYQIIDGEKHNINQKLNLPENAKFTDVISCWSKSVPETEKEDFFKFFDIPTLISNFKNGTEHICHRYHTKSVLGSPMIAEQHIFIYTDTDNGDIMAYTYVLDLTETILREARHKSLEKDIEKAEAKLYESSEQLNTERKYLNVLTEDFVAVYHVSLNEDASALIKVDSSIDGYDAAKVSLRQLNNYTQKVNTYCDKFVVPEQRKSFMSNLKRENLLKQLRLTSRFIYRYQTIQKNNERKWFEVQALPMNHDSESGDVLIAFRDIDDVVTNEQRYRLKLEKQLEKEVNQNEILKALGNSFHTIFRINLDNDFCEKIHIDNEAKNYYSNTESATAELKNLCENYITPRHYKKVKEFLDLTTLKARMKDKDLVEIECITSDNHWRRIKFIAKRRDADGNLSHVLYLTQIISDEKNREERLISIAEAAKAENEAKTDFLSRVAHDIRTPMNSLFGFLQIAEANIDDPEKIKYSLQKIRVAGDFLKELVNDVLDISKIENGKMSLKNKSFDIKSLFEELPTSIQGSNFGKELNFNYNIHDIFINNVIGDALRLKQIYTNILSNAIKYTPNGGNIDFEVYEKNADNLDTVILVVKVSDNGIGMSKEFMDKMFYKFERETDSRLNPVGGYGLGLSIVKELVDMMNGKIDVKSKLNEGSTFIVEVPLTVKNTDFKIKKQQNNYKEVCNGMHLLVAEDNELSREVMKELLFMNGISCDFANDGAECVDIFKKAGAQKYDALLMDVQMPNMTGIDASKAIRGLNTKHSTEIPIIAMTANALTSDIKNCFDAGMNQHLAKPVDINKLLKVLAKLSGE